MKMTWKAILLALCLMWLPTLALAATYSEGDFTFTLSNGTATITDYTGSDTVIVVPDELGDTPVVFINASAFNGNDDITSITLPACLKTLDTYQFSDCTGLTEVVFTGTNLTYIPKHAFAGCSSLENIVIPEGVTSIGEYAFYDCSSLESIVIPEGVKTISSYAFQNCSSLESITFPSTLTAIGSYAFRLTSSLGSVTIPTTTSLTINNCAFMQSGLTSFTCNADNIYFSNNIFEACPRLKTASIQASVSAEMDGNLFRDCTALTSATLPSTLTRLPGSTFNGCTALKSFTFPDAMTVIGSYAFAGCTSLDFGSAYWPAQLEEIEYNAFQGCTSLTCFAMSSRTSLKTIGNYAFEGCTALTTVNFSGNSSITSIGDSAFADCTSLSELCLGYNSIKSIGSCAFLGCTSLTKINSSILGGTSLTTVGSGCFAESGIVEASFPQSLTAIASNMFGNCKNLKYVKLNDGMTSIGGFAFNGCTALCDFYMPDSIKGIGNYAFQNCTALCSALGSNSYGKIKLPSSLTSLGEGAFKNAYCGGLTVPAGVTMLYAETFNGITPTNSFIHLPDNITSISSTALTSTLQITATPGSKTAAALKRANLTYIGDYAQAGNTYLYQYYLGNTLTKCLWSNPNKPSSSVTIHEVTDAIGANAFVGNTNLDNIHFGPNIASADASAFTDCTAYLHAPASSTTAVTLAKLGLITYDNYFGLSYTLSGNTITGVTAVNFCLMPADMVVPDTVTALGVGLFTDTPSLETVTIPDSVTTIPDDAIPSHVVIKSSATAYARTWAGEKGYTWEHDKHVPTTLAAVESTCDKDGLTEGSWCPECGTIFTAQTVVPAYGHTPVTDAAAEPNCTEDGLTEGSHCETCGDVLVAQELLPALGHTEATIPGFESSCTEDGLTDCIFCEVCGETLQEAETIPSPGHTSVVVVKAAEPTCTEDGRTQGTDCSVCGTPMTVSEVIPATGHTPVFGTAIDASCTEDGLTAGSTCSVCTDVLEAQAVIPALGHKEVTLPGYAQTDHDAGLTDGVACERCGETLVEQTVIPANFTYSCTTITAYNGTATNVVIPSDATALSDTLFKNNTTITSVTVPDSVTALGTQTFFGCTGLTDLYLPDGLTSIGAQTLYKVTAKIHVSADSATAVALSYRSCSFVAEDGLALRYRVTSATGTPTAVWVTGYHGSATEVVIPEAVCDTPVTQIQASAFENQTQLVSVTIPASVTSIASDAFKYCASTLVIRSSADAYARTWCSTNLYNWEHDVHTPVTIPAVPATCTATGLTEGSQCSGCGKILTACEETPMISHTMAIAAFTAATRDTDGMIGAYACTVCGLTEREEQTISHSCVMQLPASLTQIGTEAFIGVNAQQINVPAGVTTLSDRAFADCSALQLVILPDSITAIADTAFEGSAQVILCCSASQTYVQEWAEANGILCVTK